MSSFICMEHCMIFMSSSDVIIHDRVWSSCLFNGARSRKQTFYTFITILANFVYGNFEGYAVTIEINLIELTLEFNFTSMEV